MEICIVDNEYYPSFDGGKTPAPVTKQDLVLRHTFDTANAWKHGIFAADVGGDSAAKKYYAVRDFMLDGQSIWYAASRLDLHLYELLTPTRPVRPYFDLEFDDAAFPDPAPMLHLFCSLITTCLERAGFTDVRSFSVFTASGPCARYASGMKGSYHLLADTGREAFRTVADHCRFLQTIVMPFLHEYPALRDQLSWKTPTHHTALVLDGTVYKTNQVFRLPYQSKWTGGAAAVPRPLIPSHLWVVDGVTSEEWVYTCGIYEDPATLTLHDVGETIQRPTAVPVAAADGQPHPEFEKAAALCACLTPAFLEKYTETMGLVWLLWGLERTERMRTLIHTVCQRGRNYDAAWVNRLLRDARPMRTFTLGSLVVWARACAGKDRVDDILKAFLEAAKAPKASHSDELFALRTNDIPQQETRHERYLAGIEMTGTTNATTLLMKSALGTGKSVAIRHMIRTERCRRILVLSPRKSYTQSQLHALTAADLYPFHSYLDHSGPLSHLPYLIVQVESLWRIAEDFEPYDLVIMDESESILAQLHSIVTHGAHLIDNHATLEMAVRSAERVVMTDAFLTDRTAQFARALRPLTTMRYLENTYQPYARTAIRLLAPTHDQELAAFERRIVAALDAGRRVVVVWTSKTAGEAFEAGHLRDRPISYRFYHSESAPDVQEELQDVDESWRDIQCLMMTTSITVGLSYNALRDSDMYDELFLYGSSLTALPRDVAQTLLRVRRVREERLTYVIQDCFANGTNAATGLHAVSARLAAKEERVLREHPTANWVTAPKWVKVNHAWNENECVVSRGEYRAVLERYLAESGYRLEVEHVQTEDVHCVKDVQEAAQEEETKEEPPAAAARSWSEIPLLAEGDAARLRSAAKVAPLTPEEHQMLDKYHFRAQFARECPDAILAAAWRQYYESDRMAAFWNVVMERRWTLAQMARREARKRYAVMSAERIRKRGVMGEILDCLGMEYSLQRVVYTHEALVELGPRLAAREAVWRAEMGLRKSRRKTGDEWKVEHTIQWIRVAMETWGDVRMRTERTRGREEKVRVPHYQLILNEDDTIWEHLKNTPFNDDDFRFIL